MPLETSEFSAGSAGSVAVTEFQKLAMKKREDLTQEDIQKLRQLIELQHKMSDMLIARFQKNLKAFKKYMPEVADSFKNFRPSKTLEFFCSFNGIPNLQFPGNHNDIFYKCDDPVKASREQVDTLLNTQSLKFVKYQRESDPFGQIHFRYLNYIVDLHTKYAGKIPVHSFTSIPHCIILGAGLGYAISELYARVNVANLVVIEPDPDIFFACMHSFDWATLLKYIFENKFGLYLIIGKKANEVYNVMDNYYARHGRFLSGSWWTLVHYYSKDISEISKILVADYFRLHAAMGFIDDHCFAISHAMSSVVAGRRFVRNDVQLKPEMTQYPIFVVGNGPSLDNDIPFLRKNQDKAIIIACGTALDSLYHAGIKPDFYACTERSPQIAETIDAIPDKEFIDSLILMAGDVVHPETASRFKHTIIFGKPDESFYYLACCYLKDAKKIRTIPIMNPLVVNMGVSAVISLGFKNIYFFGIDNGKPLSKDSINHSRYSSIYTKGKGGLGGMWIYKKKPDILPGNFGGYCLSGYHYKLCKRHIELVINDEDFSRGLNCINCSGGAKIDGAKPVHSYDLDFSALPVLDKDALKDYIENELSMPLDVKKEEYPALLNLEMFRNMTDKVIELCKTDKCKNRLDYINHMEAVSETLANLDRVTNTRFVKQALNGSLEAMFIMVQNLMYHIPEEKEAVEMGNKCMQIIRYFLEDCKLIYAFIPDYIIGPHHALTGYKIGYDHPDYPAPKARRIRKLFPKGYKSAKLKFEKIYEETLEEKEERERLEKELQEREKKTMTQLKAAGINVATTPNIVANAVAGITKIPAPASKPAAANTKAADTTVTPQGPDAKA